MAVSQELLVLNHIQEYGTITTLEAYNELGITRLASRISDIRRKNIPVADRWVVKKNRRGEDCRVKEYYFEEGYEWELRDTEKNQS